MLSILPSILPILIITFVLVAIFSSYVKAPPDKAYVISGLRKRVIIGRAGFRIPFLERVDIVDLKMMSVDVKTGDFVPTNDYIDLLVDGAVKIKIGSDDESISLAAENFLNQDEQYIIAQVKDVLEGNIREIIGMLKLREMVQDRKLFSEKVQENAVPDLKRMGLDIISFNIQTLTDKNGVISDLGIDNVAQIQKNARIAKANADKEVAIAQSEADKIANDARIAASLEIQQKNTDLEIRTAELKVIADVQKAKADAAYEIEKEEQRKSIEVKSQEANITRSVKEIELATKEAEVKEQRLVAEVKKSADAELYQRQKNAEADLYEKQKNAEANLYIAENERSSKEEEAKAIYAMGEAEAESIKLKLLAEAEGIDAKAEAMKKYGEAAIMEMYFNSLPEIAKNVAEPLNKIDHITMYGDGNSTKMVKDIVNTMSQITNGITESTGIDLQSILSGFLGGKIATPASKPDQVNITPSESYEIQLDSDNPEIIIQ